MKKIAVFGKPASGKSTLSKKLSKARGIPLYPLDSILYKPNGEEIDRECYEARHQDIISSQQWIIEGFGPLNSMSSFNNRINAADTLVYIDLPYSVTYWLVIKRLIKGLFKTPEGWPKGSSVIKGTLQTFKILKISPKFWNDEFLQNLKLNSDGKKLYVIRSIAELNRFVE